MDLILRHKTPRARILRMQASDEEICFWDLQYGDYPSVNQRDTPPPYGYIREARIFVALCHSECLMYHKYNIFWRTLQIGTQKNANFRSDRRFYSLYYIILNREWSAEGFCWLTPF